MAESQDKVVSCESLTRVQSLIHGSFSWRAPGVFARTTVRRSSLASLNHHSATVACDLQFFLCRDNLNLVCSKAKEFETVGG